MQPHQLQKLFDEYSPALVLYARQWCAMPDDAVQEAFIDLAKNHVPPDCPKSWLYTTTRRKAQNIARSEQRRRTHQRAAAEQRPVLEGHENWFRSTGSMQLVAEDVAQGLEMLEADERELLVARIWGDLSFEQLAKLLDCSASSAHRRYSAALQRLKAAMTGRLDSHSSHRPPNRNRQETMSTLAKLEPQSRLADGEFQ
jgi:RNA polymerase sigma factor (sigma-70 family)